MKVMLKTSAKNTVTIKTEETDFLLFVQTI